MTTEHIHSSPLSTEYDPLFGENGFAYLHSPSNTYTQLSLHVVSVGPDNKIYVAGLLSDPVIISKSLYMLACLNEDGSVDTSFGYQGFFGGIFYGSDSSKFIAEQIAFVNNRILLTGELFHYVNGVLQKDKAAVRFLLDGTIDKTFAVEGKFIFHAPDTNTDLRAVSEYNEKCLEIANSRCAASNSPNELTPYVLGASPIHGDHIILLHDSGNWLSTDAWIIRLTQSGELDVSFNGSGFVRVRHDRFTHIKLKSLTVDDAGNYITAGEVKLDFLHHPDAIVLVKHSQDGRLDTTFQQNGSLLIYDEDPLYYWELFGAVKQPNNRILCTGTRHSRHDTSISGLLTSREADGSKNIQFNGGDPVFTNINSSSTIWFNTDFLPDGSFLSTGIIDIENRDKTHYAITRFLYNGVHDKDYNNGVGWLDYKEATSVGFYSSAIKNNKVVFTVIVKEGEARNRCIVRGLMP
ncbi:hypothetical protein PMI35_04964 [Pseudomonas sp. GM78]|uniref:delta-60 repeat domain-containing protein n=1 Tax=Pseudomonas sp. GM78 TaxID=1144337 RepID=UPI000270C1A6|nr:delta-60 repeat domain-containing protein [Pseudomonas sp. GM78]EJN22283.1 hypothetical protein PMI35_04964 [Pseudomonas sp. GM78]